MRVTKKRIWGILVFTLVIAGNLYSQQAGSSTRNNMVFINGGVGYGSTRGLNVGIPPLSVSVDIKVADNVPVTVGGIVIFTTWRFTNINRTIDLTYRNIGIGARGMFHFVMTRRWDLYVGPTLGYTIQSTNVKYGGGYVSGTRPIYSGKPFFLWGANVGARLFFSNNFGLYTELGYNGLQYVSAGLSLKF